MIPEAQKRKLVELGFIVVVPNYRLAPSISLYEGPLQDAKDAYAWCHTELSALLPDGVSVDPTRMVSIGYSAGATLALMMVSEPLQAAPFRSVLVGN
jgi:acetyl esterase/lipase